MKTNSLANALRVLTLDPAIRAWLASHDSKALQQAETALAESTPAAAGLTVTDRNGFSHPVIAAKRIDSFRVLVIHASGGCMPYVVHTFNESDGGFHCGHYCETQARAFEVFNADKRAENYAAIPELSVSAGRNDPRMFV